MKKSEIWNNARKTEIENYGKNMKQTIMKKKEIENNAIKKERKNNEKK